MPIPSSPTLLDEEPRPGVALGRHLTMLRNDGRCAVFHGSVALHVWDEGDLPAQRLATISLVRAHLLSRRVAAAAFGVHENSIGRLVLRAKREGLAVAVPNKGGRPHGATAEVSAARRHIAKAVADGLSATQTASWLKDRFGITISVSSATLLLRAERHVGVQATLATDVVNDDVAVNEAAPLVDIPALDATDDEALPAPDPVTMAPASIVELPSVDGGRYVGLALYYPALAAVGLLDAAASTLRLRAAERFDLRAVMLSLFFLTQLRKSTLESAKHLRRQEFGAVVGSGRAPCVKTLRRKLDELGELGQAGEFGKALARHWIDTSVVATAYLYVDGHMKEYTGRQPLQKVWNAQRRMPLPGIESYMVSDQHSHPLLLVTEEVSPSLSKSLPVVVARVREVTGARPLTLIFDRGGYDGNLFTWLCDEKIDFITYQRGTVDLPSAAFSRRQVRFEGKQRRLEIAEDTTSVGRSGPWRRIVVRTKDGHQTPILTSITSLPAPRIACLMFARWRQENLFKYLRQHQGFDTLVGTRTIDAADQRIPNPERRRLDNEIVVKRAEIRAIHGRLGAADAAGTAAPDAEWNHEVERISALETEIASCVLMRKLAPQTVTVREAGHDRVVFDLERKTIIDQIKLAAYNAEEWLVDRLLPFYGNAHDVRDLLRAFAELSGSIHTAGDTVEVALDPPDTPVHRRALRGLCDALNESEMLFPGTALRVRYAVRAHHSELVA